MSLSERGRPALADGAPALVVAREQAGRLLLRSDQALADEPCATGSRRWPTCRQASGPG